MIQHYVTATDGHTVQYVTVDPDDGGDMAAMETTTFHGLADHETPVGTIRATSATAAQAIATDLEHGCVCDHCRDAGTCFGCDSGLCP